jgi:autotransporter-associated beta strand protein
MTNSGSALVLNYTILGDSIWSGGSGNWDTGFSPAVTTNANVVFTGAGGNATNNIASATLNTLQTISFNSTAGSYTLEANSASAGHSATPLELTGSIINNSTSAQTLNLAMTFNAGRMVDTASGNITIGGVINGSGGLTKNGSGTLALTANNTFTGGVQVNAGTLATTDSGGFANSANITVASGATYNVGVTDQINSLNASGSLVLSSGTLTISSSSTNSIVSGAISGGGILTKSGSGTLTISNNNTGYSGQTFHSGGVIEIGHNGALGTGNFLLRNNGATIQSTDATDRTIANRFGTFTGANATYIFGSAGTGNLTFSNTQTSSLGDNRTFTISNSVTRFDGIFTGSGFGITKGGTGLMILAGNNTYSGATTINAGTLQISSTGLLGGGIYSGNISNSGTFLFASNSNQTIAGIISGAGAITKNGTSTLTLSGNNSYSGGTTISAGTLQITSTGLLGGGSYSGNIANSGFLIAGSNSNQILSGIISGTGALTKNGSGTLTLSGSNTYSGGTTISAGTLQITSTGLLGGGSYSGNIVNSGALIAGSNSNQILSGIISGAGALTKNGSGTLALSESNSYSGGTTLNTGTLVIGNAAAAGSGTISQSSGSSLLKIDTTGTIANNMSVFNVLASQSATLSGAITVNNATWDIDTGDTLTISGTVSGNGGVNKNGSGTLILSGSNTYVGATTVNAGTLNAAHANALGSNTTVQVNGGSLLVTADDAINGKNITLASTAAGSAAAAGLSFNGTYNGTAGSLTLSENSTIDLGTGSVAVHFSDLAMGLYKLAIYNWTGTTLWGGGNGNNTDQIYFDTTLDTNELNRISFYSDLTSSSFLGTAFQLSGGSFNQEIIPVPEPETYAVAVILLLGFGIYALRRSPRAQDPV